MPRLSLSIVRLLARSLPIRVCAETNIQTGTRPLTVRAVVVVVR